MPRSPTSRSDPDDSDPDDISPGWRAVYLLLYLVGFRSWPERSREPSPLAAQDWLLLAYLSTLVVTTALGGGPKHLAGVGWSCLDLAFFVAVVALTKSRLLEPWPRVTQVLYRASIPVPAIASFLQLHYILPAAVHGSVDAQLYAIDACVFRYEPAVAWDHLVTQGRTEWFAFFYYGYFFLIAAHMIPMLFVRADMRLLTRFSFGFLWVYCVGQALYIAVPAYGPYVFLDGGFAHPLVGSTWWPLVKHTVGLGGARTDVFPSLHTAVPTYLSLFSFLHRRRAPFRLTWLPLSLFTSQIVLATMYLRWHYLVDIVAGISLAASAIVVSRVVLRWEGARMRRGGAPTWPGGRVAATAGGALAPAGALLVAARSGRAQ